ncbi:MAG: hypothetical protein E3J23_08410 [Candidatus Stahlbacteria bacterium]|nr:MAG: hypothetical protein E3J23_08410 [Candidatus Stahlbacteria bacterium]
MGNKKRKLFIVGIFILTIVILLLSGCEERWPTDPEETGRPEITTTDPPNEVAGVPVGDPITITFSEDMDENTMNDTLFTMVDSTGDVVDGSLSWTDASTLLFTPSGDLQQLASYTAVILGAFTEDDEWKGPSVRDKNGNSLKYDNVIKFITEENYGSLPLYLSCGPNWGDPAMNGRISIPDYELQTLDGFELPMGMALTPDGAYLYVANRDGNFVTVVETSSFSISDEIDGLFSEEPWIVMVTPDGSEVWVLSRALPCAVTIIDVATNTVIDSINLSSPVNYCPDGGFPYRMAFSHDGANAYVTTRTAKSVLRINTATYEVESELVLPIGAHIHEVAVSPDDSKVYLSHTWGLDPSIFIVDDQATSVIGTIDLQEEWGDSKKFTTFGNYLYVGMRWDAMIYKIDMTTDQVIAWTGWPDDWFGDWVDGEYLEVDPSGEVIYWINPDREKIALFDSDLNYIGDIDSEGAWWGIVSRPGRGIQ